MTLKELEQEKNASDGASGAPSTCSVCLVCLEGINAPATFEDGQTDPTGGGLPGQLLECGHTYCNTCLATYMMVKLRGLTNPFPFYCPQFGCFCEINERQVASILSQADYALWRTKHTESDMRGKVAYIDWIIGRAANGDC